MLMIPSNWLGLHRLIKCRPWNVSNAMSRRKPSSDMMRNVMALLIILIQLKSRFQIKTHNSQASGFGLGHTKHQDGQQDEKDSESCSSDGSRNQNVLPADVVPVSQQNGLHLRNHYFIKIILKLFKSLRTSRTMIPTARINPNTPRK